MILDNTQAAKYSRILKAKYNIDKDYSHLFQHQEFLTTGVDIPTIKKEVSKSADSRFKKSLEENRVIEAQLIMAYQCHNYHPRAEYDLNDDNKFDMKVTYTGDAGEKYYSYVEIKEDKIAHKTKNIVIEYECRNKPSGIQVTHAPIWVNKIEGFYLVFNTQDLLDYINTNNPPTVAGGDDYSSKLFKIKVKDIIPIVSYIMVDEMSEIYH